MTERHLSEEPAHGPTLSGGPEKVVARPGDVPHGTGYARIGAWCLYDFANSAYAAIVLGFVFAPYFLSEVVEDEVRGTVLWSRAITVSAIVIGLLSPVLGALADAGGQRRFWLVACSALAITATTALWWVQPSAGFALMALVLVAVSNIGFELAYVFYNAMLNEVAPPARIGRVSAWAWGLGYLGSLLAMLLTWFVLVGPDPAILGLDGAAHEPVRAAAPLAALWFLVFALPLFLLAPPEPGPHPTARQALRDGLGTLWQTLRTLPGHRPIAWYLASHMIYIDGVNTLMLFGPLVGVGTYGFDANEALAYGIAFFAVAGIGSFALGRVDDLRGPKFVVTLSLGAIMFLVTCVFLFRDATVFWVVSMAAAFFLGPVQASSRSLMARLSPPERRTQFFGLYALAGRATGPLGPTLLGTVIAASGRQIDGALVVLGLLGIGIVLLWQVEAPPREPGR